MKSLLYILIIVMMFASSAIADPGDWLYCSVPEDDVVYHFDASIHAKDDWLAGGTGDSKFNYLEIKNFEKIGPNPNLPGYIEYKVLDLSSLDLTNNYRIVLVYAYKKFDMRPAQNRFFYAHSAVSEPLFTDELPENWMFKIKFYNNN